MLLETLGILLIVIYVVLFWTDNFKGKKSPPGPICIPPFGNLIQISQANKEPFLALHKLGKEYGDVMSIKMGLLETIVISSYEAFRSILTREEACGRDCSGMLFERNMKKSTNGMIFSEGPEQAETKKFSRDTLRHYGYGNREYMQNLTLDELTEFFKYMDNVASSNANRIIHFETDFFNKCFLNIICTLVMGKRLSYDDPEFQALVKHHTEFAKSGALGFGIVTAYPFLRHIFPNATGYKIQMECVYAFHVSAKKFLRERKQVAYDQNPECFTDSFLQKMDEDAKKQNPLFTEDHFGVLFADIIEAGTDTTGNTISFIILHLTVNSSIQDKLHKEILNVIGPHKPPGLADKANMPYTLAIIYETLRWSRILVMGVPRKVVDDFVYKGFVIKKGKTLLWNLHSIFFDEEFWGDPQIFRPDRFIDLDGTLDTKRVDVIQATFGAGKRVCFGEALARDSLFLTTAALFQKFKFTLPPGTNPDVEPGFGFTSYAKSFDAIATLR